MEDQKTVSFMRLLSDESIESTLSSDSCEYYQTEIYELLPSVQAVRSQQDTYDTLKSSEAYHGGQGPDEGFGRDTQSRGPREKVSLQPLRNLAMCMQGKRGASNIGFWESGRRSQCINRKKIWAQMREAVFSLLPWQHTLHEIQGRFGIGVKSYFVFLRYLIYLNLLHSALIGGLVLGPTAFYGTNNSESLRFGTNDSVLDFFLGSVGVSFQTIVGYKHTWMLEKRTSMNVGFKIFCGWDFNIQDPAAAKLKHSFIRNDLKLFLEEQSFSLRKAQRTLQHKVCLYLLRLILNLVVLSLLMGAFCLIYFSGIISRNEIPKHWFLNLVLQYLSPITITFVNLVLPHMFRKISAFEDYSLTFQVNATLVR
ncbi:hypothetical protein XENORESO_020018 [Xenotaenia resolanae]|uniref:Transmembrane channel-like protein n=1 Tax=Xenotaenia resolanae TaxID=208358 RepID=A0ABV0VMJ9_9TELE